LAETAYSNSGGRPVNQFNPQLQAATSQHVEAGTKFANGQGSRLNLAWFRITTNNEIVTDLSVNGQTSYKNATQTLREGVELNAQQLWGQHVRTDASLTAMRATYAQSFGSVLADSRLPATPDRLGHVGMHWAQNGFNGWQAAQGLAASLDLQGRSRLYANDANTAWASGHVLANLKLRYRQVWDGGSFEPYLGVDNLNNKQVVGSVIVNQSSGGYFEPMLPRTWVLGMQAKWEL
jgi:iron complex outermembrane receptor protein